MSEQYQLILCVVNAGFTELVMDAARAAGARGGTVLGAKGTANKEAEAFFHITIQPEKEMVMILVPAAIRDKVLHALYKNAGIDTPGQGIAFSLPVDDVVGIGPSKTMNAPEKAKEGKTDTETSESNGVSSVEGTVDLKENKESKQKRFWRKR